MPFLASAPSFDGIKKAVVCHVGISLLIHSKVKEYSDYSTRSSI
jgi:hypothetical protein